MIWSVARLNCDSAELMYPKLADKEVRQVRLPTALTGGFQRDVIDVWHVDRNIGTGLLFKVFRKLDGHIF